MAPTRDHITTAPVIDTGAGSPIAERPNVWTYEGPPDIPVSDTGIGSTPTLRSGHFGEGDTFIPPLWP